MAWTSADGRLRRLREAACPRLESDDCFWQRRLASRSALIDPLASFGRRHYVTAPQRVQSLAAATCASRHGGRPPHHGVHRNARRRRATPRPSSGTGGNCVARSGAEVGRALGGVPHRQHWNAGAPPILHSSGHRRWRTHPRYLGGAASPIDPTEHSRASRTSAIGAPDLPGRLQCLKAGKPSFPRLQSYLSSAACSSGKATRAEHLDEHSVSLSRSTRLWS